MKDFDFDSNFKHLEEIAEKMENGALSLEENLKLYEEGMNLCKVCKQNLKDAQLRIEYIDKEKEIDEKNG